LLNVEAFARWIPFYLLLFSAKSNQKLSTAPFAREGSAFTFFICTAKAKVEFGVHSGFCFYALWALFFQTYDFLKLRKSFIFNILSQIGLYHYLKPHIVLYNLLPGLPNLADRTWILGLNRIQNLVAMFCRRLFYRLYQIHGTLI
jgi:hypothetical protein